MLCYEVNIYISSEDMDGCRYQDSIWTLSGLGNLD